MKISFDEKKLLWLILIVGGIWLRHPLMATLVPFLLAIALATLIEPIVNFLQVRVRLPRSAAALISLILVLLTGGVASLLIFTKVISELAQMASLLQRYQRIPVDFAANLIERLNDLNELFDREGIPLEVQRNLLQTVDSIAKSSVDLLSEGIRIVLRAVTQVPFWFVVGIVAVLATYFLVKDRDVLIETFLSTSPPKLKQRLRDAWDRIIRDMINYLKAQLLLIGLTTVTVAIGLAIIDIDYWVTLSLVTGFLDFIPILGPGFLFVPWAIGAITIGESVLAVKLLTLYFISFTLRQLFQAKVLGDSIGVHPLNMLVALYAGIHFFGVQGFIAAPILVIIGKAIYEMRTQKSEALIIQSHAEADLPRDVNLAGQEDPSD